MPSSKEKRPPESGSAGVDSYAQKKTPAGAGVVTKFNISPCYLSWQRVFSSTAHFFIVGTARFASHAYCRSTDFEGVTKASFANNPNWPGRRNNAKAQTRKKQCGSFGPGARLHGNEHVLWSASRQAADDLSSPRRR